MTSAIHDLFSDEVDVRLVSSVEQARSLLVDLATAHHRAALTRRFLADAVRDCRHLREQRLVGLLHLAGHAPTPRTFDISDDLPPALALLTGG